MSDQPYLVQAEDGRLLTTQAGAEKLAEVMSEFAQSEAFQQLYGEIDLVWESYE